MFRPITGLSLVFCLSVLLSCGRDSAAAPGHTTSVGTDSSLEPTAEASPKPECHSVRDRYIDFKGESQFYSVQWELCRDLSDANYVRVEFGGSSRYSFGPAETIDELEVTDFHRDGRQELLVVEGSSGTGGYIEWCVLGWVDDQLKCWTVPDLDKAAAKILRADEDFCCKGWQLRRIENRIVLGRGIYQRGVDANCCPSRGGAFIELVPEHGHFEIAKAWRTDSKFYDTWARNRVR